MDKNKITVMVVEDEFLIRENLKDILTLEGYSVLDFVDGKEALDYLSSSDSPYPNVIVSDVMMPNMNGYELLASIRKNPEWATIPFIFLTALSEKNNLYEGRSLGMDEYIIKPFGPDDLLNAIESKIAFYERIEALKNDANNKIKQMLLSVFSHEFRTPLSLIVAYSEMLHGDTASRSDLNEFEDFLSGIKTGADRLKNLIEKYVLIVEIVTGQAQKRFELMGKKHNQEWLDFIETGVKAAELDHNNAVAVSLRGDDNVLSANIVTVDEYLVRITRELVDNAIKFSKNCETPSVEVSVYFDQNHLVIQVSDNGRGIPVENLDEIWDVFYQAEREVKEDQGLGNGLAIVKGLVEIHRGHVSVVSSDKGTAFYVYLPIA